MKTFEYSIRLAKLAYDTPDIITETLPDSTPAFFDDEKTGAFAFSMKIERTLYFIFRGSGDACNDQTPYFKNSRIKVHKGFKRQFSSIKKPIMDLVKKSEGQIDVVQCIGHSFGGALATLFAGHIASYESRVVCHTFGCPRVGNKYYVRWFCSNVSLEDCARITNVDDPVSNMPMSRSYRHVCDAKCLMNDLTIKSQPDAKWYLRLFNWKSRDAAHRCDKYEKNLKIMSFLQAEEEKNARRTPICQTK